jgi:hypothetical protein
LDNVQTSLVSTYTFINPIVAVLLGTMILGEPFSASITVGACLVIVSIIGMWVAEHMPPFRIIRVDTAMSALPSAFHNTRHAGPVDDHRSLYARVRRLSGRWSRDSV